MTYLYAAARAPRQNRLAALVLSLSCLLVGLPSGIGLLLLTPSWSSRLDGAVLLVVAPGCAYLAGWRLVYELWLVDGVTLVWRGVLRHNAVPVEDVTAVGSVPFSPWLLNFRRADARPLLVSQMHNLLVLIEQVQQANPADPRSPCGRTPSGSLPTGR
jgi:hypothetical protein